MREGYGTCPVCQGSRIEPLTAKELVYTWNQGKTHRACSNCGGQTMMGIASGITPLRKDNGEPCVHSYKTRNAGRCYNIYTCEHCNYSFDVDSGD